jgi:hypothetical protein
MRKDAYRPIYHLTPFNSTGLAAWSVFLRSLRASMTNGCSLVLAPDKKVVVVEFAADPGHAQVTR